MSIAGGKLTTYRLMARDVIDAAVADFPRAVPPSVTDQLPLLGADGLPAVRAAAGRLAEDYGVPAETAEHLISRYGALAGEVLELVRADKSLGRPLAEGHPYLRAEVAYAVTHEGALHVEDVLGRRVRLLIESPDAGASAAAEVAAIMGKLLGWSRRKRAEQTRRYQEFAATTSQALLPAPASPPAAPPAKPEPPGSAKVLAALPGPRPAAGRTRPSRSQPLPSPSRPYLPGGWAPIPRSPYSRSLRPYPGGTVTPVLQARPAYRGPGGFGAIAAAPRLIGATRPVPALAGASCGPSGLAARDGGWLRPLALPGLYTFTIGLQEIYLLPAK